MKSTVYLDNNATTQMAPELREVLIAALDCWGNPSSVNVPGREARAQLGNARASVARYFGVHPKDIVFHSGATEGLNALIQSLEPGTHLITSAVEHACVYEAAKKMERQGVDVTFLPSNTTGTIDPLAVEQAIRRNTRMIALMAVNNETGVKNDIDRLAAIADGHRIPFIVDGVALLGKESFHLHRGVTAWCFSGHKIHGPKGVGVTVYGNKLFAHSPLLSGGQQESGRRAGTENVPAILAFARAIELLDNVPEWSKHMASLRDQFEGELVTRIPGVYVNGSGMRVSNTSNLAFEGVDGESLLMALDMEGISASHGSACASGSLEPSRVLLGMGVPRGLVQSSIRFSLSRFTTEEEIQYVIERLVYHTLGMRR